MKRALAMATLAVLLAATILAFGTARRQAPASLQSGAAWPKFHANAQNTGVGAGMGASGALKWTFTANSSHAFTCSPVVGSDGTVYIGDDTGVFYAVNGATGAKKWSFQTGNTIESAAAIGQNGDIYVGSDDGTVYALNAGSGAQVWTYPTGGAVSSPPAIGSDGTVYVGSADTNLYALDPTSGFQKWSFTANAGISSGPAIESDGTIVVGSDDFNVYGVDSGTGLQLWAFTTGNAVQRSPAIDSSGNIYCPSNDGNLYSLSGSTGNQKWAYSNGSTTFQSSPAFGANGLLYIGNNNNSLYAFDPGIQTYLWAVETGGPIQSSPAIASDGTVFVGSNDKSLYAYTENGVFLWSYTTSLAVSSSPAIGADGTVYFASDKLYAIGKAPISNFYLSPNTVTGGVGTNGVVQIAAKAAACTSNVKITGGDGSIRYTHVATLAAGKTGVSFAVTTSAVTSTDVETLTATYEDSTFQATLTVNPNSVSNFYASPSTIVGGSSTHGVVQMAAKAGSGGDAISLSTNSNLVTVPATVNVASGSTGVSFSITSTTASASTVVSLKATYLSGSRTTSLTLNPYAISHFYASPSAIAGGAVTYGVVQLTGVAGSGGDVVHLSSGDSHLTVPATVTVPAGKTGVSFQMRSTAVSSEDVVTVTATLTPSSMQTTVTLNPPG